ncbi:MAG TPA: adenosylmethionine--8-amino-7-oxononanoate transaminase, partial [Candidatus Brocadiaceae bacterium]|nr:adenosylmethionine--8-amino-7-oxononanoate transaminase [Candidatus Brocadiaceae bacterium]
LIAAIELAQDKATKTPYPWEERVGVKVCLEARRHGLLMRPLAHIMIIMPPLIITPREIETVVEIVGKSIEVVTG